MIPAAMSQPVSKASAENIARVNRMSLSRLTRSATTPPHIEKTIKGLRLDVVTRPTIKGECVSSCINHSRPEVRDHMPKLAKAAASQKNR